MINMQTKILTQIESIIASAKLEPVCNNDFANQGVIFIQRLDSNETLGTITFAFCQYSATLKLKIRDKFILPYIDRVDYQDWYVQYAQDTKGLMINKFLNTLKTEIKKI